MVDGQELVRLWNDACALFDQRLDDAAGRGSVPTTCAEWTVDDLITHTVGTQQRYATTYLGYDLGDRDGWPALRDAFRSALEADRTLDTAHVHHPLLGDVPRSTVFGIVVNDLFVHCWDLARALGADEALPADAVDACFDIVRGFPPEVARLDAVFGPETPVTDDADQQTRFLSFIGRHP